MSAHASTPRAGARGVRLPPPHRPSHSAPFRWLAAALLVGCGAEPPDVDSSTAQERVVPIVDAAPRRVEVERPQRPLRGAIDIEALSETLDVWLQALGNKVRIRDFDGIGVAFSDDFVGEALFPAATAGTREVLPLGVERWIPPPPDGGLERTPFLSAIEDVISPWSRLSQSNWRLVAATYQRAGEGGAAGLVDWACADIRIHLVGHTGDGGMLVLDARATARVANVGGEWRLERFRIDDRTFLRHDEPIYSEVSRAAGVAVDGLRFGEPGNDGDGWAGAAAADVDGDGRIDLFVPGARRGFLYRAAEGGVYEEQADERGLAAAAGGTGAVFFDYDRDGDQDLAVAFIGWRDLDESLAGRNVTIYENDGQGRFRDASEALGLLTARLPAYSLTAFDADGDGWTDLFACGYGRMDFQTNDNWIEATNGACDLLLRNQNGQRFVDVTEAAGLVDRRWSYASAAADYDEDGDLDLYVGNNFGTSRLWRNRGDGTFEDVAAEAGVAVRGNVMGVLWTDLDGDGRLDLYLASPTSTSGARLLTHLSTEGVGRRLGAEAQGMMQMANGNKIFLGRALTGDGGPERAAFVPAELGGTRGGWAWSVASPDIDLDGRRDIVCVNGFVTGELSGDT